MNNQKEPITVKNKTETPVKIEVVNVDIKFGWMVWLLIKFGLAMILVSPVFVLVARLLASIIR